MVASLSLFDVKVFGSLVLCFVPVDVRCLELGPRYFVVCFVVDVGCAVLDVLLFLSFLSMLFALGGVSSAVLGMSLVVGFGVFGGVGVRVMFVVAMVSCVSSAYIVTSCVCGVSVNWERESGAGSSWLTLSFFMVPLSFSL